ncbi:virB8 family protein [Sphingorhabdus sp.]|uniref:virB8 family protein n=1 Tax=Sphingorhabdus sp. TaxID=1902408 RepID=UPI003593139F
MNKPALDLDEYYRAAASWGEDREREIAASRKTAWIIAGVATAVALIEAIALIVMLPLKTVVPYTLLVDKQTGYVEQLKPVENRAIDPDAALIRSFLVQYVIERESFDIDTLNNSYRKVALWSAGDARTRYINGMQATNAESPLARLPRTAVVDVKILSVSSLEGDTAMVRFTTKRGDAASAGAMPEHWVAVIRYRFSGAAMSAEDRMTNPLGFQVIRYRRNAETLPAPSPSNVAASPTEMSAAVSPGVNQTSGTPLTPKAELVR